MSSFTWTNESAWKIRAEFERSEPTAAELWSAKGIALPAPDSYREINLSTQIHNVRFVLKGIAASNVPIPGERRRRPEARPRIYVEFDPGADLLELSLRRAVDQLGHSLQIEPAVSPPGGRAFSLQTSPETAELDLTFALRQTYAAEFLAKPSLLVTNLARWQMVAQ